MSHFHILGIGGTFMAGLAVLAREAGHTVTGQDAGVYPPMSDVLTAAGIEFESGYADGPAMHTADTVIVGNALSRGNPAIEALLEAGLPYTSGPAWLAQHILPNRWVIAVAGTHGKTTTASLIAWLLEAAGLNPGFLIGGQPGNFTGSARLGSAPFFVLEADEYDTAFFDKRSKFLHFNPRTLVLNNLEFDHADIFPNLAAIERQFALLLRNVPGTGKIFFNPNSPALARVLEQGCWSEQAPIELDTAFTAPLPGQHNVMNTTAALLAAQHAGVPLATAIENLAMFKGVRRRLELRGRVNNIDVYDDFAHHPTAIAATLSAFREQPLTGRLIAVLEPRSNSMRNGTHANALAEALQAADQCFVLTDPALNWDVNQALAPLGNKLQTAQTTTELLGFIVQQAEPHDTIVVMSNGAFDQLHERLLSALEIHKETE
ncbi:UDP-N-acetylmuramate:L-alanyl-gamma-D-glutamyl-meso-diaminopimelate ligase [Spiribacter sp. C176]|uniref:UDP-N-acetylmuramate:L-alanyl-gamma-D-glutamyl-meso-diaminopimelate ligase n=1 Tax=Spiribacter salilacus TaxID=2664894 RepID=A0A6N7QSG4_9GAMM|nr:Mur ligase domain-containing protein [Spiribacter salilacus]MRH78932.1 UDP-N-acetylmuramate:L-alanyl-gamma-D-glutamyl-meso-diaminopimelate ligase [Spiribacter salilacus]